MKYFLFNSKLKFSIQLRSRPSFRVILKKLQEILSSAVPPERHEISLLFENEFAIDGEPKRRVTKKSPLEGLSQEAVDHGEERKGDAISLIQSDGSAECLVTLVTSLDFTV